MSFYTSLSGLQASQTDMSVISHNLANVGTNGFKKSRAEFADVMAANFSTDPFKQVGSGTVVKANRQEFKEGNYTSTSNVKMYGSCMAAQAQEGATCVGTGGDSHIVHVRVFDHR